MQFTMQLCQLYMYLIHAILVKKIKIWKEIKQEAVQKLIDNYFFFFYTFSNTVGVEKHSRLFF